LDGPFRVWKNTAMPVDERFLRTCAASLARCNENERFLERFYEIFLASSPKVSEKFAHTDFVRQRQALLSSLHAMILAAREEVHGPAHHLRDLVRRHGATDLQIGAELYDLWLDSLLATVAECDPENSAEVQESWERVMMVGIRYLLDHYAA
jgi:hemoglobin-like flavoprotein